MDNPKESENIVHTRHKTKPVLVGSVLLFSFLCCGLFVSSSSCVLCAQCFQILLDCPFLIAPSLFSNICLIWYAKCILLCVAGPHQNRCASKALVKCKQLLTPMRHLPCHLHSQNVLDTIIMIPIRHTCYQSPPLHETQQFHIYVYLETGNIMRNATSLSYIESEGNYIVFFLRFSAWIF
jgi:hypothetical protein